MAADSVSACLSGSWWVWLCSSFSSTLSKMSPLLALAVAMDVDISRASGIFGMLGVCIVLALVRDGEAGLECGDSSLVKLRDICRARGLRASVGAVFIMFMRCNICSTAEDG